MSELNGKVIVLNNVTRLNLPVDRVLEAAKEQLEGVILIGYTKEGEEYFASTYADGGDVLCLIERFKKQLLGD